MFHRYIGTVIGLAHGVDVLNIFNYAMYVATPFA